MAMLDALALSESLGSTECPTVFEAISAYETAMRLRAGLAAQESLDNGELMHSENALFSVLDLFSKHKPGS